MAYSSPATVAAGNVAPASWGNSVKAATDYLANPPACRVYHNTTQSATDATPLVLVFNSERYDTDSMHNTSSNTDRITFNTAGLYLVTAHVTLAAAADYLLTSLEIWRQTTNVPVAIQYGQFNATASGGPTMSVATVAKFAAGEYVQAKVYQDNSASAARNVMSSAQFSPEFSATWIGLG